MDLFPLIYGACKNIFVLFPLFFFISNEPANRCNNFHKIYCFVALQFEI